MQNTSSESEPIETEYRNRSATFSPATYYSLGGGIARNEGVNYSVETDSRTLSLALSVGFLGQVEGDFEICIRSPTIEEQSPRFGECKRTDSLTYIMTTDLEQDRAAFKANDIHVLVRGAEFLNEDRLGLAYQVEIEIIELRLV